jgi:hypothetical protein
MMKAFRISDAKFEMPMQLKLNATEPKEFIGANPMSTPSESKHTPGPWTIDFDVSGDSHLIVESESADAHVAFVFIDMPQDAKLIAAAPELLAACEAALARMTRNDGVDGSVAEAVKGDEVIRMLSSAIAKARKA